MKASHATTTPDLLGEEYDLAGQRPAKPTKKERNLARVKKWREKNGVASITANLPAELVKAFHEKRAAQGKTVNEVLEKLLRSQYLRAR